MFSLGLLAIIITSSVMMSVVAAQTPPVTEEQIARIKINCVSAKNIVNRVHLSDALLRVNRGQMYESMSTKLMERFNARASGNRYVVTDLLSTTQSYDAALKTFHQHYISYEEQMSAALRIDCTKEPVSFYDAVAAARTLRSVVHSDVIKLHQLIDDYKKSFDVFQVDFRAIKEGNSL